MSLPARFRPAADLLKELGITEPEEIDIEAIAQHCDATVTYGQLAGSEARIVGADDKAIHDTVLIAAAFSMYTRYVDGLATWAPGDPQAYDEMGAVIAENGYTRTIHG